MSSPIAEALLLVGEALEVPLAKLITAIATSDDPPATLDKAAKAIAADAADEAMDRLLGVE